MDPIYGFATEVSGTVLPLADWDGHEGPGWIFGLLFWVALITVVILLIRGRGWFGPGGSGVQARESASQILERRFAEGEIDAEEYRERRAVLGESARKQRRCTAHRVRLRVWNAGRNFKILERTSLVLESRFQYLVLKSMKHDDRIGHIRKALQELSRLVFSKKYRLEIAALVTAQESPIWARQVARALDIGENQAASELAEFEKLGALQRFPDQFDRRKLYLVVPHWLWTSVREALEDTVRELDSEEGDELVAAYWASVLDGASPQPLPSEEIES